MSSMRSLVYVGPGTVEWREAEAPTLDDDHVALVRPLGAAVCDLDRRIARGAAPLDGPFALGHEAMGEVVEVGDDAARAGIRPGRRVVVPYYLSCGTCARCAAGRPLNCTTMPGLSTYGIPFGGEIGRAHV